MKRKIIIAVVLVLFVLLGITFLGQNKDIKLSDETMQKIAKINWQDAENLKSLGFKTDTNGEKTLNVDQTVSSDNTVSLLRISMVEEVSDGLNQYGNYTYEFTESTMGKFDIRRLWTKKVYSYRSYNVYVDGINIHLREDANEGDHYAFEKAIDLIFEKQKNKQKK